MVRTKKAPHQLNKIMSQECLRIFFQEKQKVNLLSFVDYLSFLERCKQFPCIQNRLLSPRQQHATILFAVAFLDQEGCLVVFQRDFGCRCNLP